MSVFSKDITDLILEQAKKKLGRWAYLQPLQEKYPLREMGEAPEMLRVKAESGLYPVLNDGRAVYFSIGLLAKWLEGLTNDPQTSVSEKAKVVMTALEQSPYCRTASLIEVFSRELAALVSQQYLHLLLQHSRATRYFRTDELDNEVFRVATEIEVNRSPILSTSDSFAYSALPNTELFPETANCLSLRETYAVLKQEKDSQESLEQTADSNEGKQDGNSESDDQQKDSPQNAENGSEQPSGSQDDSDTDQDGESQNKGSETAESDSEKLSQARRCALERMTPQEHQLDTDDELLQDPSVANRVKDFNIQKLSQVVYDRWHTNLLRRQMKKLRGVLQGEISRKKRGTYARPTRRDIDRSSGLIKRGVAKDICGQPKILVALDTSGSMDKTALDTMLEAVANTFADLGRPSKGCWVCLFNDDVFLTTPLRRYSDIIGTYSPYGGTNYDAVLRLANKLDVDVVLEIGDGEQYAKQPRSQHCKDFLSANRRWYDVIIQANSPIYTLQGHILTDLENGFPRKLVCIDPDFAEEAHALALNEPLIKEALAK